MSGMFYAKVFTGLLLIVDLAAVLYASATGNFFEQGSIIVSLSWGQFTLIDIYAMFILFSAWIWHRTSSRFLSFLYTCLTFTLGSLFAVCYVFVELFRCEDDWNIFWHGSKSDHLHLAD